jgi:predicted transcriptional regulator
LIPAFPLDGGRVLRSILWHVKGSLRWATRITSTIGSGFGLFLILLGVLNFIGGNFVGGMWQVLIGMFLRGAAQMSYQQVLIRRALEGEPIDRFMNAEAITVPSAATVHEVVDEYVYKYHHKMFPVADNGRLLGCITTQDIQRVPREQWDQQTVGDVAQPCDEENTIQRGADAMEALSQMQKQETSRLMVVQNGHLEGVLSLKDMLKFIALKVELENDAEHLRHLPLENDA